MSRKKRILFLSFFVFFAVCYFIFNRSIHATQANKRTYEVSVICRSENTETWSTMKQGIDQAAKDLNIDVSFITLSSRNNAEEQVTLLNREVRNGANAIVIAPVNSGSLNKAIADAKQKVPVIAMQSAITGSSGLKTVSCDNAGMGRALARELEKTGGSSKVMILRNSMNCSNVSDSLKGIEAELKNKKLIYCDIPNDSQSACNAVRQCLRSNPGDAFIALDPETLETAGQAKKDLRGECQTSKIYGIGRTNKVVSFLEGNVITAVAVENDYNMGYLCMKSAIDGINRKNDASPAINYLIVNRSNIYQSESERILFPFIR
jgi:ribose transport system substrate-binding protein